MTFKTFKKEKARLKFEKIRFRIKKKKEQISCKEVKDLIEYAKNNKKI